MTGRNRPARWEPAGTSGRFQRLALPLSPDALELSGGRPRSLIYGEFDTGLEPEAWRIFMYDPLRVLLAEGLLDETGDARPHLQVNILKLTGPEDYDEAHVAELRARGDGSARLYESVEVADPVRARWNVTTSVVNHESPLNPRIGMATVLV